MPTAVGLAHCVGCSGTPLYGSQVVLAGLLRHEPRCPPGLSAPCSHPGPQNPALWHTQGGQATGRELGDEPPCFIDGSPSDWVLLPQPDSAFTVGIDGGYLRHWCDKQQNFEVIVGKSV